MRLPLQPSPVFLFPGYWVKRNLSCCWALLEESVEAVQCPLSTEDQLSICITSLAPSDAVSYLQMPVRLSSTSVQQG